MEGKKGRKPMAVAGLLILAAVLFLLGAKSERSAVIVRDFTEERTVEISSGSALSESVSADVPVLPDGSDPADEVSEPMDKMKIALTFDDGPHPVYTEELLDGLKERNVKATFFIVGENAELNPDIVKRISEEGHLLGNHTYTHVQLTSMPEKEACEELVKTSKVVEEITGKQLEYVRPPFGSWDEELDCDIMMIPVLWSVDSRDWTTTNVSEIVRRVVTQTKENDIILMHDYYASSVEAAFKIIDQLTAKGYEFVTADELILN